MSLSNYAMNEWCQTGEVGTELYCCSMNSVQFRAHREIKNQNRDSHTWIFIGNRILNLICFLQFFDLSTPSAAKMRFYYLHFLQGKNAQNRPENPQN